MILKSKLLKIMLGVLSVSVFLAGCSVKTESELKDETQKTVETGETKDQESDDDSSKKKETEESEEQVPTETEKIQQERYGIGDTITSSDYEITLNSVETYPDNKVDGWVIIVNLTYTNLTDDQTTFKPSKLFKCYLDNEKATNRPAWYDQDIINQHLILDVELTVDSGRSITGYVLYMTYVDWEEMELQIDDNIFFAVNDEVTVLQVIEPTQEPTPTPLPTPVPEFPAYTTNSADNTVHKTGCQELTVADPNDLSMTDDPLDSLYEEGYAPCPICLPDEHPEG